jgi:hypothetical protein
LNGAVSPCGLPAGSSLRDYADAGAYADCYAASAPGTVSLARYVSAFYHSPAFRPERLLLRLLGHPSDDADIERLAAGTAAAFAAWTVESRTDDSLLLRDVTGRTRSWLKVEPGADGTTRLYFGSVVVPRQVAGGEPRMGPLFGALLGFHRFYSRALLASARKRLLR